MPKAAEPWSLTSLREKLIKIGAKVVSHGRYVTFQMAEVAVSGRMFKAEVRLDEQSNEFRRCEAGNPTIWLPTGLVAIEFRWGAPR
jgi:hypothetical protein